MSNALSIVEMNVHMDCEGCEKRVRKAMSRLEGTYYISSFSRNTDMRSNSYVQE